jgi:hypothetical protein
MGDELREATDDILGALPPLPPYDPRTYMFTARTIDGARAYAAHLPGPGEVWELEGRYYPVMRHGSEAAWLAGHGGTVVPAEDDILHRDLDLLLPRLRRTDASEP